MAPEAKLILFKKKVTPAEGERNFEKRKAKRSTEPVPSGSRRALLLRLYLSMKPG